ncbi:UDP-2,3-diacylglucosamine diphosphatase [Ketobacter sp.]|uniref:UDP-2,3-diacylglucosamine diphosphatase n=1 Tax=Ketobacter sp. TaxID=2083498 RepID=UPI0025C3EC77|nr:UDP-2,3-diacylglucosamine diphosphatase [Ketobacter sp.]
MIKTQVRSAFVSDVHLGTSACQAQYLLDFLKTCRMEYLYLVGDIIDLLHMRRRVNFTPLHEQVVEQIMALARQGTRVIYIPGNHDALMRRFCGQMVAGIEIHRNRVHYCADGRRFFVSHGDEFDSALHAGVFWYVVGDLSHTLLLRLNTLLNGTRRLFNLPYWSLAGFLKKRIGKANQFIRRFETIAARQAQELKYDGFICGHIHQSGMRRIDGVLYCNDGDWVEHCTALVETNDGRFELVHWADHKEVLVRESDLEEEWVAIPQTN